MFAFFNNKCHHFLATGVEFRKEQNLDELEEVKVKGKSKKYKLKSKEVKSKR